MCIIFGLFFFFSMQILFVDMLTPAMQIPALLLIGLGVLSFVFAFRHKPEKRPKKKKSTEQEFLDSVRR